MFIANHRFPVLSCSIENLTELLGDSKCHEAPPRGGAFSYTSEEVHENG